jgi:hypothetical protein
MRKPLQTEPPSSCITATSIALPSDRAPVFGSGASGIVLLRFRLVSSAGRLVENMLTAVRLTLHTEGRRLRSRDVRAIANAILADHGSALRACAKRHAEERARALASVCAGGLVRSIARERSIAQRAVRPAISPVQAGLFDERALKTHRQGQREREAILNDSAIRAKALESESVVLADDAEVVLLLISC